MTRPSARRGGPEEPTCAVAWLVEQSGPLDGDDDAWGLPARWFALATFSGHVERGTDAEWMDDGRSLPDALAWARARAPEVVVRWYAPGGWEERSAGSSPRRDLPGLGAPPELEPRRIPGWEHLDRTASDPPISWEVLAQGAVVPADGEVERDLRRTLREHAEVCEVVDVRVTPMALADGCGAFGVTTNVVVHLRLEASTRDGACAAAAAAAAAAIADCRPSAAISSWAPESAEAFPTRSRAAERNARIDRAGSIRW